MISWKSLLRLNVDSDVYRNLKIVCVNLNTLVPPRLRAVGNWTKTLVISIQLQLNWFPTERSTWLIKWLICMESYHTSDWVIQDKVEMVGLGGKSGHRGRAAFTEKLNSVEIWRLDEEELTANRSFPTPLPFEGKSIWFVCCLLCQYLDNKCLLLKYYFDNFENQRWQRQSLGDWWTSNPNVVRSEDLIQLLKSLVGLTRRASRKKALISMNQI